MNQYLPLRYTMLSLIMTHKYNLNSKSNNFCWFIIASKKYEKIKLKNKNLMNMKKVNALSIASRRRSIQIWQYVKGPHTTHIGIRDNETSPQQWDPLSHLFVHRFNWKRNALHTLTPFSFTHSLKALFGSFSFLSLLTT
jgi:hypothetical protein